MKGRTTPIYPSTSYAYLDMEQKRYPRYFNIPNQGAVVKKVAQLEGAETGVLFGSGMAAISTAMLSQVRQGDHVILQKELYGGTIAFVQSELPRCGVEYTFTEGMEVADFEAAIRPNTRLIHIETPSNPLLTLV
ncbi:MAG: PLP-dependent transferase, partial [Bacteroidota bacterium]